MATGIKTQAELEALLNEPDKLADHIAGRAVDLLEPKLDEKLEAKFKAAAAKAAEGLGGKTLPMSDEAAVAAASTGIMPENARKTLSPAIRERTWGKIADMAKALNELRSDPNAYAKVKVLTVGTGADGGYLVPPEFRAEIMALALEGAIVRPRATVIPMGSNTLSMPAIDSTSHATTVYGGVQAYWAGEAATLTASQPRFSQIKLEAWKLTALARITNELLRDSSLALAAFLQQRLPEAVRYFEDDAFIQGTGAGQPLGMLNAANPSLVSVAKETGQAANTIVTENIDKVFSRMLPSSINRAVWLANPETYPQLASMTRAVGTGGSAVFVSNMAGGPPNSLMGRPVIFTEKCAALGTAGDIAFVDPAYYLIGDRQQVEASVSEHVYFLTDESALRFIERVDGEPWLSAALTPRRGTATLSPFVTIATRA